MRSLLITLAVLFVSIAAQVDAAPMGSGRHFIVAFPDTLRHLPLPQNPITPSASLVIFAQQRTSVTITGPGISTTVTVDSARSSTVQLPTDSPLYLDLPDVKMRNTFDVTADGDIIVYAFFVTDYGSEAFTPLPVDQWDTEYFVASTIGAQINDVNYQADEERPTPRMAPAQFAIIAATDNTDITLTGVINRNIQLNNGEAYLIETGGSSRDFIGTRIVASAPIAVIAGSTRTLSAGGGNRQGRGATRNTYQNVTIDWLAPTSRHGTLFGYVPVMRVNGDVPGELIRLVATSPGMTNVRLSTGRTKTIPQGDTIEINTLLGARVAQPFMISTDKPSEAVLVTGHYIQNNYSQQNYTDANTWATAMSELTPRERWIDYSRFHCPSAQLGYEHAITIVADPSANVWLDGKQLQMQRYTSPSATMKYYYATLAAGDHDIRSAGGRFGAVVHGHQRGYEAYKPPIANPGDEKGSAGLMHPSTYWETMALSYAYPLVSLPVNDSLSISTMLTCDSMVVVVDHSAGPWSGQTLNYRKDPGSVNTLLQPIINTRGPIVVGFRFRFMPIDRTKSASMSIRVISASGIEWPIEYHYEPVSLAIVPNPVAFVDVPVGIPASTDALVINSGMGEVEVTNIRLVDGTTGFSLTAALPHVLAPGDTMPVTVTFTGAAELVTYRDSIVVETECADIGAAIVASTREIPREPVPAIDSVDWFDRWLSTMNTCTKSGINRYDSLVTITNLGNVSYVVRDLVLEGADADSGFFAIDRTDPTESINAGDTILPASLGAAARHQRVLFRPRDERAYSCLVRLETTDGMSVYGELRGVGIESHIVVAPNPLDAGDVAYAGGLEASRCTATVRSNPSRPLLVRSLVITGIDAADYTIDETGGFITPRAGDPSTWWQMLPGEEREVPLIFSPIDTGFSVASLEASGDHSRCDDSTIVIIGRALPPVDVGSVDPIVRTACGDTVISAIIVNSSTTAVMITRVDVAPSGSFTLVSPPSLPLLLAAGDTLSIPVRYQPSGGGNTAATLAIDVFDEAGVRLLQLITVRFSGIASSDSLHARVVVTEKFSIGSNALVPIVLDTLVSPIETGALKFSARWNGRVLRLLNILLNKTIAKDWALNIDAITDSTVDATLTPPAGTLLYNGGVLCELEFLPFLGPDTLSPIDISLSAPDRRCVVFTTTPAVAHFDSICGLATRLIEMFPEGTLKIAAAPNPFSTSTTIVYTLPVPAHVRIEVADASGSVVGVIADEVFDAGVHVRNWTPEWNATGLYFLRLTSGDTTRVAAIRRVQ